MNANRTLPGNRDRSIDRAPAVVHGSNSISTWLLQHGLPMGPNGLLTVRGRSSGQLRTAPVAVVEAEGHRYIIGAYGDVNWTRNLRAAGEADFRLHGRTEHVTAKELDPAAGERFFAVTLPGFIARLPWFGRLFGRALFGLVAPEIRDDPKRAAETRPVFELTTPPKA